MYRLQRYYGNRNIGDAMQTIALAKLLQGFELIYHRSDESDTAGAEIPFIVNGFLCNGRPTANSNCLFAGVYTDSRVVWNVCEWIRQSRFAVGARDSHTAKLLNIAGIPSTLVGCATLTLPAYTGPRRGVYSIDTEYCANNCIRLTQACPGNVKWAEQLAAATQRLELLRTAELVYTSRLHVVLPCLAYGTPVVMPAKDRVSVYNACRLTLLDDIGFSYSKPVTDLESVKQIANTYKSFLAEQLKITLTN